MAGMRATTLLLPGLAAAALGAGGCGGGGSSTASSGAASGRERALQGALKFARCMRGEGIDIPDPQTSGNGPIRIGGRQTKVDGRPGPKMDPRNPRFQAAQRKCGKYLQRGGGEAPDAATQARVRDAFVAYATCMRKRGVNVPDPKPGQPGLIFRAGDPNAPDPESPAFKAADEKCHDRLAAVEKSFQERR